MTFGFPAYHRVRERFRVDDTQIIADVKATAVALAWVIEVDEPTRLHARRRLNLWSWGELIRASARDGVLELESRCRSVTQCFDWGVNKRNVEEVLAHLPAPLLAALDAAGGATGAPVAVATIGVDPRRTGAG